MIPAILLKGVEPVTAVRAVGSGRDGASGFLSNFQPGDVFRAQVEARLPNGNYKVLAAGQTISLALPSYLGPGDWLELVSISSEPNRTFSLKSVTSLAPGLSLSMAGRLLAATMLQPGVLPTPVSASTAGPLLALRNANGAQLSDELAQTFAGSGLFYESHQAEWLAGTRNLAQILQEPQARLTNPIQRDEQTIQPQAVPIVQQQLAALDSSTVLMQLEIWPKQWLYWTVEERQPGSGGEQDLQQDWNTQLRLALPQLGQLIITLSFGASGVSVRLDTSSAASAVLLQGHRQTLLEAFETAGLPAASVVITHHD